MLVFPDRRIPVRATIFSLELLINASRSTSLAISCFFFAYTSHSSKISESSIYCSITKQFLSISVLYKNDFTYPYQDDNHCLFRQKLPRKDDADDRKKGCETNQDPEVNPQAGHADRAEQQLANRIVGVTHGIDHRDALKPRRHKFCGEERVTRKQKRQVDQVDQRDLGLPVA